jgi:GT2 family glycosyltransferase
MPSAPLVSVIVPCFNQGQFLTEAIASVHAQTFRDFEIVVIEDCSTEGFTRDFVRRSSFAATRVILNSANGGVAAARNTGIRAARGIYVLPLDADDRIAPEFVAEALALLETDRADVAYSLVTLFGRRTGAFPLAHFSVEGLLRENLVVNTALYRKAAWAEAGGYAAEMQAGLEDWDFWLSLVERGNRFRRIEKPLFFYRQHGSSRTDSAREADARLRETIFARHRLLYERHGLPDAAAPPLPPEPGPVARLTRAVRTLFRRDRHADDPASKPPIALHYFDPPSTRNFGDQLNVPLVRRITGRPVRAASVADATHLCIGSLLEQFLRRRSSPPRGGPPLAVWGAGFIAAPGHHPTLGDDAVEQFARPLVVHAVRGQLSLERLRAMGEDVSRAALGDPGLLARLLAPAAPIRPRHRLGLVAHYVDERDPVFARVGARVPSAQIIKVGIDPVAFLARLRECEVVLSSAMHGLVAADALGIPNARIRVSDRLTGGDYKFRDYYSAFGVEPRPLSREELWNFTAADLARVEAAYPITAEAVDRVVDGLLASCPFTTRATDASLPLIAVA